jgi:hypothetical protein
MIDDDEVWSFGPESDELCAANFNTDFQCDLPSFDVIFPPAIQNFDAPHEPVEKPSKDNLIDPLFYCSRSLHRQQADSSWRRQQSSPQSQVDHQSHLQEHPKYFQTSTWYERNKPPRAFSQSAGIPPPVSQSPDNQLLDSQRSQSLDSQRSPLIDSPLIDSPLTDSQAPHVSNDYRPFNANFKQDLRDFSDSEYEPKQNKNKSESSQLDNELCLFINDLQQVEGVISDQMTEMLTCYSAIINAYSKLDSFRVSQHTKW